jgi:hypothetical protein
MFPKNLYLTALVFVSGAAVLAVELLGTRVLGPFYGVSLFLWSALITVTLLALSVGYAIGGRMADRAPSLARLCFVLLGAGGWLLVLPWMRDPVLRLSEPAGLRAAVLVASLLLFAPPLTLLGMVAPYAIRLRASSLGDVGRTAGDLYALSTVGSVLAALLTGFVLIPYVGVGKLLFLVGALLVGMGLLGLLASRRVTATGTASLALAPLAFFGFGAAAEEADPARGLLSIEHSPYAEIRVVELDGTRYMLIDGGTHTIVQADTLESVFSYVHRVGVLLRARARPAQQRARRAGQAAAGGAGRRLGGQALRTPRLAGRRGRDRSARHARGAARLRVDRGRGARAPRRRAQLARLGD